MTHGEETSEETLDDERSRMTAYVRCGFHRALPVMEGEDTVPQVGPGNIESRGKEKKNRASRNRRKEVEECQAQEERQMIRAQIGSQCKIDWQRRLHGFEDSVGRYLWDAESWVMQ